MNHIFVLRWDYDTNKNNMKTWKKSFNLFFRIYLCLWSRALRLLTKNRKKFQYQTTDLFKMFKTFSFIYPEGKQGHKIEFATNFGILNTIVLFNWSLETSNCKRSNLQNTLNKSMLNICSLGVKLSNCYNCFLRFSGFPDLFGNIILINLKFYPLDGFSTFSQKHCKQNKSASVLTIQRRRLVVITLNFSHV